MQYLMDKISARELTYQTKWKDFVQTIKDKDVYLNLVGQIGSTPRELFEDAVAEEKELLNVHKSAFK